MMKSIDRVRRAIRERRIAVEGPALLLETRNCIGDRDRAFELLQCAVDQGAMSPWAAVGNIEVISPCLCLETRRTVRRNAARGTCCRRGGIRRRGRFPPAALHRATRLRLERPCQFLRHGRKRRSTELALPALNLDILYHTLYNVNREPQVTTVREDTATGAKWRGRGNLTK